MTVVRTTISIDAGLWQEFSIIVIKERGYRAKNAVVEDLIRQFVAVKKGDHGLVHDFLKQEQPFVEAMEKIEDKEFKLTLGQIIVLLRRFQHFLMGRERRV